MIIICDNDYDDSNPCVASNVYMGAYMLLHISTLLCSIY